MAVWGMALLGAGMGYGRGLMQDRQTLAKIRSLKIQAGWEEDYGDQILDQANKTSKRIKRVAYRKSISIMNSSASKQMQIKAQAERVASSQIVQAAGRGADVGYGTPLESAALQMETGDAMARTDLINARNAVKNEWDSVKWQTDQMKTSAKFQRKMKYRKAALMREGAQGLEDARGANMFMNILGGTTQGASMGMSWDSTYGTGGNTSSQGTATSEAYDSGYQYQGRTY